MGKITKHMKAPGGYLRVHSATSDKDKDKDKGERGFKIVTTKSASFFSDAESIMTEGGDGFGSVLELSPLKPKDSVITLDYVRLPKIHFQSIIHNFVVESKGTYTIPHGAGPDDLLPISKKSIASIPSVTASAVSEEISQALSPTDEDEESMDWWTKYFASVDAMIEVSLATSQQTLLNASYPSVHAQPLLLHYRHIVQICPKVDTSLDLSDVTDVLDSSLTPAALKKFSKSVVDLTSLSEMKELSKSTSNLVAEKLGAKKKKKKAKSESKTSLVGGSVESLDTITVSIRAGLGLLLLNYVM